MRLRRRSVAVLATSGLLLAGVAVATAPSSDAATGVSASFAKVSDWGSGFEGRYTITNGGPSAISSWTIQFDMPAGTTVGTYWDALVSASGNHYTAKNREYNGSVGAGGSVSFGFLGSGSGAPLNCTINGSPCSGGGNPGDTQPPSAPGGLRSTGTTGNSVSLAWAASTDDVGVAGYDVFNGSALATSVTGTSATVTGLSPNTSYTFTVKARDAAGNVSAASNAVTAKTQPVTDPPPPPGNMAAAPYLYYGWGSPPSATAVMSATGVKWFTLAFILSSGGCTPAWDGQRSLTGADATRIAEIRAAGGDVIPSFGGWSGAKLGENCSSASALAGAYQQVINAYRLKAIDIDIEASEFESDTVQQRVIDALKIVKANNSGIKVYVTFGTSTTGPTYWGTALISKGAAAGLAVDGWVQMPFDFGGSDMGQDTINATEGLKTALTNAYGYSDDQAYRHSGISSMNGQTDDGETVTLANYQTMLAYAKQHHLARFTFWSVNRDRPCSGSTDADACSGISQQPWDFTKVAAQYTG